MFESEISTSLPRMIALDEKYCKPCKSQLLFRFFPKEKGSMNRLKSICPQCNKIIFIDNDSKKRDLIKKSDEIKKSLIISIKRLKRSDLIKHHFNTQSIISYSTKDSFSIPFELIYQVSVFIQMIYKHGDQEGTAVIKHDYLILWKKYLYMNKLNAIIDDLQYDLIRMDNDGNRYYNYKHVRRVDGMGEYGSAPHSRLKELFEGQKEIYEKELEHYYQIKHISDHFTAFEQNDPDTLEFVENFSKSIQSTYKKMETLNLKRFLDLNVSVNQVRKWRKNTFWIMSQNQKQKFKNKESAKIAKNELEKILGQERGKETYEFLVMTPQSFEKVPYALDIEGFVYLVQSWAYYMEILLLAESEGEKKFKMLQAGKLLDTKSNVIESKSKIFEKKTVPALFRINNCETKEGFKELDQDGNIIFEIDQLVLDEQKTLWIVEIKSKTHSKRFMELKGWERECREYIDRTDKTLSYPQIVDVIRNNLQDYQLKDRIPNVWDIRNIEGLIVTQLPPFEESYKNMYIIDYKEIRQFLNFYYS